MRAQTTHLAALIGLPCLLLFPVLYQNQRNRESLDSQLGIDDLDISEEEIS